MSLPRVGLSVDGRKLNWNDHSRVTLYKMSCKGNKRQVRLGISTTN